MQIGILKFHAQFFLSVEKSDFHSAANTSSKWENIKER